MISNYSARWPRNPHIKGRMNPSLGLVVAIPGDKHPCYGGHEPVWEEANSYNVHFYYRFDFSGNVLVFEPLHLTRYGNVEWNREEVAKMRKRLVGGYLTTPWVCCRRNK